MSRAVAVLRPSPGNERTAGRIEALGLAAIRLPLFSTAALAWCPPEPDDFDALLLTSANAVQLAGPGLERLRRLPVFAVGDTTAAAATAAGLRVKRTGHGGAAALASIAREDGVKAALHLTGIHHAPLPADIARSTLPVYVSETIAIGRSAAGQLEGTVLLLHSTRAAHRVAQLFQQYDLCRAMTSVGALSPAVAKAIGTGWAGVRAAVAPTDQALIACARSLADR